MGPDSPYRDRLLLGFVVLTLVLGAVYFGVQSGLGAYKGGYELRSSFERVIAGLESGSQVKIRGVTIGEVKSIKLDDRGRVIIALRMHDDARVPDTAVASVEPLSIFGPKFVKLTPGTHELSGPFLRKGGQVARSVKPVEFLETLSSTYRILRAVNPEDLGVLVHTIAQGLGGEGPSLGRTVDSSLEVTDLANRSVGGFTAMLGDLGPLGNRLADSGGKFAAITGNLHQVLPEIASRSDKLGVLLDETATIGSTAADLLSVHRAGVHGIVTGGGAILAAVYAELGNVGPFLEALRGFGQLGRAINVAGPGGSELLAARGLLPADPCRLVVGRVCPSPAAAAPARRTPPSRRRATQPARAGAAPSSEEVLVEAMRSMVPRPPDPQR